MSKDLRFVLERDTKRTYVFKEVDEDGNDAMADGNHWVGSLYVQKSFFNGSSPSEIFVRLAETADGLNEAEEGEE